MAVYCLLVIIAVLHLANSQLLLVGLVPDDGSCWAIFFRIQSQCSMMCIRLKGFGMGLCTMFVRVLYRFVFRQIDFVHSQAGVSYCRLAGDGN